MAANAYAQTDEIDSNIQSGLIVEYTEAAGQTLAEDVEQEATISLDIEIAKTALVKGTLINLPLFEEDYVISIDKTYAGSEGVVTYSGLVYSDNEKEAVGDILLTYGGGLAYGLITTPSGVFQIIPHSDDKASDYALLKMKQMPAEGFTDFESELSDYVEDKIENETELMPAMARGASCCTVDVLVLFTHRVRSRHGGTTATINWVNTIIASYNQKLAEVGLGGYSFRLKSAQQIIYNESLTATCTSGGCDSIVTDQHWLINNGTVANLRNQYSADLVALITSNGRKATGSFAHGFAGLKGSHGGYCYNGITKCGQFITVRDDYALSNLTFHHEAGHALGMIHEDGVKTFGVNSSNATGTAPSSLEKPQTIMEAFSPICSWSTNGAGNDCHVRLPFYADDVQYRTVFYSWFGVPRKFDHHHHVEDNIVRGFNWLANRR